MEEEKKLTMAQVRELGRLRHVDPKTRRKLRSLGDHGRDYGKQWDVLAKEGIVGTTTSRSEAIRQRRGTSNFTVELDSTVKERIRTLKPADRTYPQFMVDLLDAFERPKPAHPINTEAANVLAQLQGKLKLASQLETVDHLIATLATSQRRAERIRTLEEELAAERGRSEELSRQLAERPAKMVAVQGAASDGLHEVAFKLVDAMAGTTATIDGNGEIVVAPPPGAILRLFDVTRQASALIFGAKQ